MDPSLILQHYLKPEVEEEITSYSRDRWIAIHCGLQDESGRKVLVRYRLGRPLKVQSPTDIEALLRQFIKLRPRSFYASSNLYRKLDSAVDVASLGNIYACTPCWDIDNELSGWRDTLKLCEELISLLEKEGVVKSVSLFWSGRGAHVRIHHLALSPELRARIHPLDAAYAMVEYVASKLPSPHLRSLASRGPRVENKIDPQRVFTCPLSLHRDLDVVCVCIPINKIWEFNPSWTQPINYRHSGEWRKYEEGEADELALRAHEVIGGYPATRRKRKRRRFDKVDEAIAKALLRREP